VAISDESFDIFSESLAMVFLARVGDVLERVLFPSLEIASTKILGQPIKNMI